MHGGFAPSLRRCRSVAALETVGHAHDDLLTARECVDDLGPQNDDATQWPPVARFRLGQEPPALILKLFRWRRGLVVVRHGRLGPARPEFLHKAAKVGIAPPAVTLMLTAGSR